MRYLLISTLLISNCILDPIWKIRDDLSDNKIPRDQALSEYYNAVLIKATSCDPKYTNDILIKGSTTLFSNECGEGLVPNSNYNELRELRSCRNRYAYVESGPLKTCLAEVYLSDCAGAGITNVFIFPSFASCVSLFNTTSSAGDNIF